MQNIVYLKDLNIEKDLEDITDSLLFSFQPSLFEGYEEELIETCLLLMEEFIMENPTFISDPDLTFQ